MHACAYIYYYIGRWGFVHIAQYGGFVTNGSNHWILHILVINAICYYYIHAQ